jgi:hypothetical protein
MTDKYLDNLLKQYELTTKDLLNIRIKISDNIFGSHHRNLKSDLEFKDIKFECIEIEYKTIDDIRFTFSCTYVGNMNTILIFEYEDGWFCTVTKDSNNPPVIISECESINKFCVELTNSLSHSIG